MKLRMTIAVLVFMVAMARPDLWAGNDRQNCTGGSDNATWAADTSTSIVAGQTGGLGVTMTSPTCLNSYTTFPGTLSVYADVSAGSATCKDGSSGSTATCVLSAPVASITNNPQQYFGFGQTETYNVGFDATNATPGTYTFQVHANASDPDQQKLNQLLNGYGWGYGGGTMVTVTVTQPKPTCDPDDSLSVSFASPTSGNRNFCNGGTSIPINVTAFDTSNLIMSLTASVNETDITSSLTLNPALGTSTSVNATGTYNAGPVGIYLFEAEAATACTNASASASVNLIYTISGLQPPLANGSKAKPGSNAPLKIIPRDCSGAVVPFDSTVHMKVYDVTGTTLLQDSYYGGCTGTRCAAGETDVRYDASTGQYISNFQTDTGANTYTLKVFFGGVVNFTTTFSTSSK